MNQSPARIFTDRYHDNCRVSVEQNANKLGPYDMQGGVWFCVKDGRTIAAVDLTDDDAAELGEFLREITARRPQRTSRDRRD